MLLRRSFTSMNKLSKVVKLKLLQISIKHNVVSDETEHGFNS